MCWKPGWGPTWTRLWPMTQLLIPSMGSGLWRCGASPRPTTSPTPPMRRRCFMCCTWCYQGPWRRARSTPSPSPPACWRKRRPALPSSLPASSLKRCTSPSWVSGPATPPRWPTCPSGWAWAAASAMTGTSGSTWWRTPPGLSCTQARCVSSTMGSRWCSTTTAG